MANFGKPDAIQFTYYSSQVLIPAPVLMGWMGELGLLFHKISLKIHQFFRLSYKHVCVSRTGAQNLYIKPEGNLYRYSLEHSIADHIK